MVTSLAEELKKLTVPQTSLLVHTKKKASLLFDPKEAAGFDRETFYEIGVTGFEELKKLNSHFEEFGNTLFSSSSQGLERSVESHATNKKLDETLRRFLIKLSPYFLLRPSHQALEWLIYRFHIHEYNKEDLLLLILPYHETKIFVKVLQLLNLKDEASPWHWLKEIQKPGVPLPKLALLNHCASDVAFLKFVCNGVVQSVKELGGEAGSLVTMFAFLCSTVVGALEKSTQVTELQLSTILPMLMKGLSSPVVDFALTSFMITAQLTSKACLAEEVLVPIINKVAKNHTFGLRTEQVALLVLLYQTQAERLKHFPTKAMQQLLKQLWFPVALGQLAAAGCNVTQLLIPMVSEALKNIQEDVEAAASVRTFTENIVANVPLDENDTELIIRAMVKNIDDGKMSQKAAKDIKGVDGKEVVQWYTQLLKQLERRFPGPYDKAIKAVLKDKKTRKKMQVIFDLCDTGSILEKLNHPVSKVRLQAVKHIVKNFGQMKTQDREALKHTMSERLRDDDHLIVSSLLDLGLSALLSFVDFDFLLEALISLAVSCWQSTDQHSALTRKVLQLLCSCRVAEPGLTEARILLALFPYLLPITPEDMTFIETIIGSEFAKSNKLLMHVREEMAAIGHQLGVEDVCKVVWMSLQSRLLPDVATLSKAVELVPQNGNDVSRHLMSIILMANAVPKNDPKTCLGILNYAIKIVEESRMYVEEIHVQLDGTTFPLVLLAAKEGTFAVQAFIYCLIVLMKSMSVPPHLKETQWWNLSGNTDSAVAFLIRLFEVFITGCSLVDGGMKMLYIEGLKGFFKIYFPMLQLQIQFVSKLCVGGEVGDDSQVVNPELQIHSLRLATALLNSSGGSCQWLLKWSNTFVPSVLVALASCLAPVRQAALELFTVVGKSCTTDPSKSNWGHLVRTLLTFQEEIKVDADQLALAVQDFLENGAVDKSHQTKTLHTLLSIIVNDKTPAFVSSILLSTLKKIHSDTMFATLVPLGKKVLSQQCQGEVGIHGSAILRNILLKLGTDTSSVLGDPQCWQFVETMLMDGKTRVWDQDGKHTCPAVLMLQQISGELFGNLESELQHRIFDLLVTISTSTDQTEVLSAVNHVVKVIILDASLLLPHLVAMKNASVTDVQSDSAKQTHRRPRRIANPAPSPLLLQSETWKKGVTVLELIPNKKKLHSVHLILPVLFDVLKKALEFEEQVPVEYTKQLLLSCMLHCLEKLPQLDPEQLQPEKVFNVELVIQCIRSTQNPQTQHHALLLLSYLAGILPEQVLHNMMSIFTFIGYSVLRLDDAYSFQIITKILDSVIPILTKQAADKSSTVSGIEQSCSVAGVLRVFADALMDVPVHRRLPVFERLLNTMDTSQSLWIFLCLVLESHVVKGEAGKTQAANASPSKRVEFCLEFTLVFSSPVIMETCIHIMDYIITLPASKDVKTRRSSKLELFDVEQHSPKQLRHFRYALSSFLCSLLSSTALVNKIASLSDDEIQEMEPLYATAIETVLRLIKCMARETGRNASSPNLKYWKIMLNQSYEMLNKVNSLLPSEMFLRVVRSLLDNKLSMVRRKAMELLNKRLQHQVVYYAGWPQQLLSLLAPITAVVDTIVDRSTPDAELELNQQTALMSLKLLTRTLAADSPQQFVPLLDRVTNLVTSSLPEGIVLASVVLLLAELTSALKAHAIVSLPVFMPALIKLLHKQRTVESPNVLVQSVVTAVYKIIETLANFMSPYLDKLLLEICVLSGKWQEEKDAHIASTVQKLKSSRQKISTCIPSRVLVPVVTSCYSQLLKKQLYSAVGPLMAILSESFSAMSPAELVQHQPDLATFFQKALQFRSDGGGRVALSDVTLVEGHCVDAVVSLILKLSESYFKPLYYGLYHWATSTESHKDRAITFYRVSNSVAEKLKGLCVLFAGHFIKNAADLLDANNTVKTDTLHFGSGELATVKAELLLEYILKTLHQVFMYDSQKFMNKERLNTLMQPIVDQLENTLGGLEALTSRATSLVVPCIMQLAVAVADDALWKDLIYQVLLKTRHNTPEVRLVALKTLCEVVRVLGDAFMPFLPETVPFLAELLEDEHEGVEKEAKKAVQEMEEIIGEPLQKYF